jgi:hypothetical protein
MKLRIQPDARDPLVLEFGAMTPALWDQMTRDRVPGFRAAQRRAKKRRDEVKVQLEERLR